MRLFLANFDSQLDNGHLRDCIESGTCFLYKLVVRAVTISTVKVIIHASFLYNGLGDLNIMVKI